MKSQIDRPLQGLARDLLAEQLLAASLDGVLAFDTACRYTYWNTAMERMSGISAAELIGRCAFDVFPFLRETGEEHCFQEALRGHVAESHERPFLVADTGKSGFYEAHYAPVRSDTGEIVGGMAIVRDITERRRATEQLRETESRFRNMADASPVLLWMSGPDALCTFFNQSWLEFTGRTLAQEWGVGWAEGVHPEDFQRCMDEYLAAFAARNRFEMEYRLRRADGEFRWILDRGTPRYAPGGEFAGYIGSCVDITDRKQLEVDLRRAIRARDDFLSIAAHELRTPLTALLLQLERLLRLARRRAEHSEAKLGESAEGAVVQAERLTELVDELLDSSRIGAGSMPIDRQPFDLGALGREVAGRMEAQLHGAGCTMALNAADGVVGRWDRGRLDQVITNLLGNAIKYGAGKPVELTVEGEDTFGRLIVRDHGIGIAPEDQMRVFEQFARAVSPRHYGGFGLGLWITRRIVDAHGGRIRLESQPGAGATFTVELPR